MQEYKVRVKDISQGCTHSLTETAKTPNQANSQALKYLRKYVGLNEYEVKSCKPTYRKHTYFN